jgi:hypothetical protein
MLNDMRGCSLYSTTILSMGQVSMRVQPLSFGVNYGCPNMVLSPHLAGVRSGLAGSLVDARRCVSIARDYKASNDPKST